MILYTYRAGRKTLVHHAAGIFLATFFEVNMTKEKIVSVFIDESGDFGEYDKNCPYYLVSMVLHNQGIDISKDVNYLNAKITSLGFPMHAIHVGPLIRRESIYKQFDDYGNRAGLQIFIAFNRP